MPWRVTTEVERSLAAAGAFLARGPVANNAVLTEAHFWTRLPGGDGGLFGWWQEPEAVEAVVASFAALGVTLRPSPRLTLLRQHEAVPAGPLPDGHARRADPRDLPLLREWFRLFQAQHPEDRSHVAFVVDHPLQDGGITVWERDGRRDGVGRRGVRCGPLGSGTRRRPRAGRVRLRRRAGAYESRGFVRVLERVALRRATADPGQSRPRGTSVVP